MGELENSFIQVDDRSLAAFDQPEWKIEQTPQSGELVIINAVEKDEKMGSLSASFVVTRDFDEAAGLFMEAGRAVHLSSVSVRPAYF